MALDQRREINKVEVLATGDLQVQEHDLVLIGETWQQVGLPHRRVIASSEPTPVDVQTFLDNSKSI